MDVQSALSYYRFVKKRIGHSVELWSEFTDIIRACRAERFEPCSILTRIAALFHDFPDLISGFQAFLPDCYKEHLKTHYNCFSESVIPTSRTETEEDDELEVMHSDFIGDNSVARVSAFGSFEELEFFERVKNVLGHPKVFNNFLHCLELYIDDHLTCSDLVTAVTPFLINFPELLREFRHILGIKDSGENIEFVPYKIACIVKEDEETALDIDYCSGKRLNASYRPLSKTHPQPICSGRTQMCKEVLNDTWVSFPAWSEDSTFGATSKTKYEETMYRIEDERFELDMAIRTNAYVIDVLNNVQKRINKMADDEKTGFSLDDSLGGTSSALNYRFIHRIYGNRTKELMEGLKRNPVVAVPIVLNRLRVREKEWKEVQDKYNLVWSEQVSRLHLKSLDHQGLNFKQTDAKNLRPKSLLNEIEAIYDERRNARLEGSVADVTKPHIINYFKDLNVFSDAVILIVHDVKRQPGIYKEDVRNISELLCYFVVGFFNCLPDLMNTCKIGKSERRKISDSDSEIETGSENSMSDNELFDPESDDDSNNGSGDEAKKEQPSDIDRKFSLKLSERFSGNYQFWKDEESYVPYSLFFINNNWYIFFRLFTTLVDRLASLYLHSLTQPDKVKKDPEISDSSVEKPAAYSTLLNKVGHLLSGKIDCCKFEDDMRELFGIKAYVSYTLDKVIHAIVKQLHIICTDDVSKQSMEYHTSHLLAIKNVTCPWLRFDMEHRYRNKMSYAVEDEDNCYKLVWYKKKKMLAIELLESIADDAKSLDVNYSAYIDKFVKEDACFKNMPFSARRQLPIIKRSVLKKQHRVWATNLQNEMKKRLLEPGESSNEEKTGKRKLDADDEVSTLVSKKPKLSSIENESESSSVPIESDEAMASPMDCDDTEQISEAFEKNEEAPNITENQLNEDDSDERHEVADDTHEVVDDTHEVVDDTHEVADVTHEAADDVQEVTDDTPEETDDAHEETVVIHKVADGAHEEIDDTPMPVDDSDSEKPKTTDDEPLDLETEKINIENDPESKSLEEEISPEESVAEEDAEDSINVSAKDLLFHLSETGMGMFDCFPYASAGIKEASPQPVHEEITKSASPSLSPPSSDSSVCLREMESMNNSDLDDSDEELSDDFNRVMEERKTAEPPNSVDETECLDNDSESDSRSEDTSADESLSSSQDEKDSKDNDSSSSIPSGSEPSSPEAGGDEKLPTSTKRKKKKKKSSMKTSHTTRNKKAHSDDQGGMEMDAKEDSSDDSDEPLPEKPQEPLEYRPTLFPEYYVTGHLKDYMKMARRDMIIIDNPIAVFQEGSYKIGFSCNYHDFIYRKFALSKAKQEHKKISLQKSAKFNSWHKIWLQENVTAIMMKSCHDWLLRSDHERYRLDCVTKCDKTKPPYLPYSKYFVRRYKRR